MSRTELLSFLFSGIGITVVGFFIKRLLATVTQERPGVGPELESLWSHTQTLISKRVWNFNPGTSDINGTWVALSAEINDRIPATLAKRAGGTIKNLNSYLRSKEGSRFPIAITGAPGSGKTFELVKLYFDIWKNFRSNRDWLPILIFANELGPRPFDSLGEEYPLRDFLVKYLTAARYLEPVISFVETRASKLRLVLLFDALDEIPDKQDYDDAISSISKLFLPDVQRKSWRFILTCRSDDYDPKLRLRELEIQPLSTRQINRFFSKKTANAKDIPRKWRSSTFRRLLNPDMKWFEPFIDNPYFLSLMLNSLEASSRQGSPPPIDLRALFSRTLHDELKKVVRRSTMGPGMIASFEAACSVLAVILLEKTLRKQEAVWSPNKSEDVQQLLSHCEKLLDGTLPYSLIRDFVHSSRDSKHRLGFELPNILTGELASEVSLLISSLEKRSDLADLTGILSVEERDFLLLAINQYKEKSQLPSDIIACSFVTLRLLREGIDLRLLRDRSAPFSAITGFRHRRLFEYFAAIYFESTRTLLDEKLDNLWYKQTLVILGGIQTDPGWLLAAIRGESDQERLVLLGGILRVLHPNAIARISSEVAAVQEGLTRLAFSPKSTGSVSLETLEALAGLLSAHPKVANAASVTAIINGTRSVPLYRYCFRLLKILEQEGLLAPRHYLSFALRGFRNIMTLKPG